MLWPKQAVHAPVQYINDRRLFPENVGNATIWHAILWEPRLYIFFSLQICTAMVKVKQGGRGVEGVGTGWILRENQTGHKQAFLKKNKQEAG